MKLLIKSMIALSFIVFTACNSSEDNNAPLEGNDVIRVYGREYDVFSVVRQNQGSTTLITIAANGVDDSQITGNVYFDTSVDFASVIFTERIGSDITPLNSICDSDNPDPQGLSNPNIELNSTGTTSIQQVFEVCNLSSEPTSLEFDITER